MSCNAVQFAALERKWSAGIVQDAGPLKRWLRLLADPYGTTLMVPKPIRDLAKETKCSCSVCQVFVKEYGEK